MYADGRKIVEDCGAHHIVTSSTRMEYEAIYQALGWLERNPHIANTVLIAADSMMVLTKIQNGYVPALWPKLVSTMPDKKLIWCYVPGHAGVAVNERANRRHAVLLPSGHRTPG